MLFIRSLLLPAFILLTLASTARLNAVSVDYAAAGNFVEKAGSTGNTSPNYLPAGNLVRLGTFTSGYNFSLNSTNFAATNLAFTEYDNTVIGAGGAPTGEF